MSDKNQVFMNSGKNNQEQKIKALAVPIPLAIKFILDMDEYPKLDTNIKVLIVGIKNNFSREEIRSNILVLFGNKPLDEFKVLYEKEYNILTERFGKAIWG